MAEFFKVGDHVRVRQWSDMAIEFGVEDYDNEIVAVPYQFIRQMHPYCGCDYTVTNAQSSLWDGEQIQIIKCAGLPNQWTWSNGMFEFADTEPKVSIASVDELL